MKHKKRTVHVFSHKDDEGKEVQIYKVRAAITLSHYLFVEARSPYDAERIVDEEIREVDRFKGGYDWYGLATNFHVTYEVEESEEFERLEDSQK